MKRNISFCFVIAAVLLSRISYATLSYTLTVTTPGYTPLSGGTSISGFNAGCSDGMMSGPLPINFTFVYDSHNYTQFQVTENGRLFLGNTVSSCSDNCGVGCDGFGPSYQVQPSSGAGGGLAASVIHPTVCPLWDDLGMNVAGSQVTYKTSGTAPNRTLTVEWLLIDWKFNNTNMANTATISFQVVLYESPAGQIDFFYRREPEGLGATPTQHAKIGLTGFTAGDYYSTNDLGVTPSKTIETDVAAKPSDGARFRWAPVIGLPVELLSFAAHHEQTKNVLSWQTASESDNDHFTIERSTDAVYFETIASIKGTGNTHETNSYSYADGSYSPAATIIYYRLQQTDLNGNLATLGLVPVNNTGEESKPPEAHYDADSGQLDLIIYAKAGGNYGIAIADPVGRMIFRGNLFVHSKGRSEFPIAISALPPGIYSVLIVGEQEQLRTKFVN